jgi:hypothetical protein
VHLRQPAIALALVLVLLAVACGDDGGAVSAGDPPKTAPETREWRAIAATPVGFGQGVGMVALPDGIALWGGLDSTAATGLGAVYDAERDAWTVMPPSPISLRMGHSLVWTGHEVIAWGGQTGQQGDIRDDGAAYDPASNRWRTIAPSPIGGRSFAQAVWTGSELIVWGGVSQCCPIDSVIHDPAAAAYDPAADTWRRLPDVPEPWSGDDGYATTVATPSGVLLWRRGHVGRLDEDAAAWTDVGVPEPTDTGMHSTLGPYATATAIGDEMFVWFGEWSLPVEGHVYDARTGTWRDAADLDPIDLAESSSPSVVSDGQRIIVARGSDQHMAIQEYDLVADSWQDIPDPPVPPSYDPFVAVARSGILLWGGEQGAIYGNVVGTDTSEARADRVPVTLWHCGINPITVDGVTYEVPRAETPFDQTNAPDSFVGEGTIRRIDDDELEYRDDGGVALHFVTGLREEPVACA